MTKHNIEKSVRTLKNVRDTYYSQLDISVITELNTVITDLEKADNQLSASAKFDLRLRALKVLGLVITLVSNLHDLMK